MPPAAPDPNPPPPSGRPSRKSSGPARANSGTGSGTGSGSRPGRPRRWPKVLLALFFLLGLVYLLRAQLLAPLIVDHLEARAREAGHELRIERLGGSWLTSLSLEGVEFTGGEDPSLPRRVELRFLKLEIEPVSWALGGPLLGRLLVDGLRLEHELAGAATEPDTSAPTPPPYLGHLPRLELRDLHLELALGAGRSLSLRDASVLPAAEAGHYDLQAAELAWEDAEGLRRRGGLGAELSLDVGRARLSELRWGEETLLASLTLDCGDPERPRWDLAARLALEAGDASARADWDGRDWEVAVRAEAVELEELVRRSVGPREKPWRASLDLELRHATGGAEPGTRVSLAARSVALADFVCDELRGELLLDGDGWKLPELELVQTGNRLLATGWRLPATGDWRDWLAEGAGDLALEARDLPSLLGRNRWVVGAEAVSAPEHRLRLDARLEAGTLSLSRGDLETPGGSIALEAGSIALDGEGPPQLELALDLRLEDLAPLGPILGTAPAGEEEAERGWGGSLEGRVALAGAWPRVVGTLELEGNALWVDGVELGGLELRAEAEEERAIVHALELAGSTDGLRLSGAWSWEEGLFEDVLLRADVSALERYRLPVAGSLHAELGLSGPWESPLGSLRASGARLDLGPAHLDRLELAARVEGEEIVLEGLQALAHEASFDVGGKLRHEGWRANWALLLERLDVLHRERRWGLAAPVDLRLGAGEVRFSDLVLEGAGGALRASCDVRPRGATIDLGLQAFDLSPFLAPIAGADWEAADLSAELAFQLAGDTLLASGQGSLGRLRWSQDLPEHTLDFALDYVDGRLELPAFELRSEQGLTGAGSASLPLEFGAGDPLGAGELRARASLRAADLSQLDPLFARAGGNQSLAGEARVELELEGTWADARGSLALAGEGLGFADAGGVWFEGARLDAELDLQDQLKTRSFVFHAPGSVRLDAEAALDLGGDLLALAAPALVDLSGTAKVVLEDSAWLTDAVGLADALGARRLAAVGEADLDLSGTLARPRFSGRVSLRDGTLRLGSSLPAFEALALELELSEERAHLTSLTGALGAAPFAAEGEVLYGDPEASEEGARETRVRLSLRGDDLLLYRQGGVKVRADTELTIRGPARALVIEGLLGLQDCRMVRDFDFLNLSREGGAATNARGLQLFSLPDEPLSSARFDVRVEARQPFRIENNVLNGSLRPELHLRGNGLVPQLEGVIYVDPTRVSLPSSTLRVTSGTVVFRRENPFVPEISAAAEARTRGYDVRVAVSGPYDQPEVVLASNPPLSNQDLLYLLLTGQVPSASSGNNNLTAAQSVGLYLAEDFLSRWFGSDNTEAGASFLERFQYESGKEISLGGLPTLEARYRVTEEVLRERDQLFLVAEYDSYDRINFGLRLVFRLE